MRPTLRSERQMWREAFCAAIANAGPMDTYDHLASLADAAVEHWRKRYGREEEPEREPIETRRHRNPREHPFTPVAAGSRICDICSKLDTDHEYRWGYLKMDPINEPIGAQRRRKPTGEPFYPRAHQFVAGLGTNCKECGEPENYPAHVPYPDPCRLCAQPKDHPFHDLNGPTYSHVYTAHAVPEDIVFPRQHRFVLGLDDLCQKCGQSRTYPAHTTAPEASRYSHKFEPGPLSPYQCRICAGPEEAIIHQGNFVHPGSQHAR